jgi:hypothetical protein
MTGSDLLDSAVRRIGLRRNDETELLSTGKLLTIIAKKLLAKLLKTVGKAKKVV